ncbi:SMI1/KNR4 family protein SUKH-1 [Amycolatopsis echigonensis]|uniref:SMI1/KNR4 family protein SUKH-1 n=1 Tax=Amycolatopsis echigonensis TaxID=2576905 RepID=A0A2N3WAH3_9PSEU|nr:SMI1/KNR4 family protein [Amycolatopsis niigatensis]PKV90868.1 SMI1/KNR4 family protein SUKH-1 [Amycolatopsis niigatensis]
MQRDDYLETAVRDVLTGDEATADRRIGHAALLLATAGASDAADRLVTQWHAVTGRPASVLADNAVRARAWAMLFEARGDRPQWADALVPLDLDAEEQAHHALLARRTSDLDGLFDGSPIAGAVSALAPERPDPVREALAAGDLDAWAALVENHPDPDVATLAATRPLAARLAAGADPLGLGTEWPDQCAGALIAALRERHPTGPGSLPELVAAILRLRGQQAPAPASPEDLAETEHRLGFRLPGDYREFLTIADGLPADVVFPRLLPARELRADGTVVIISDPATVLLAHTGDSWRTVEVDLAFGSTAHDSFRALLEHHHRLLEASA